MKLSGNKKIIFLAMILIIIAGIIIIALKGFNVGLNEHQHKEIDLYIGKAVELSDIKGMCKEVLGDKTYEVRMLDAFSDSVRISFESITDEEQDQLYAKINEKYGTNFVKEVTEDATAETTEATDTTTETATVEVTSIEKIRIRDMVRPYIMPTIYLACIMLFVMLFRYWKYDKVTIFSNLIVMEILTIATLLGLIAIVRIPLAPVTISVLYMIALVEFVVYLNSVENEISKTKSE